MGTDSSYSSLITIDQLIESQQIPLNKSTIYRLVNRGDIRAYKPGKEWLFDANEVLEDIKRNFRNSHGNTQIRQNKAKVARRLSSKWR